MINPLFLDFFSKRVVTRESSYNIFRYLLLKFIRPVEKKVRLRLGFSHLRKHKFRYGVKDKLIHFVSYSNPLFPTAT